MEEGEERCRVCYGGPRGLADALVAPCGCTGTSGLIHVSCLYSWQLEKMRLLRDAACCEVCGQRYRVPSQAAAAWEAENGGAAAGMARDMRMVAAWQAARPWLVGAARLALWGARALIAIRHLYFWLGQAAFLAVQAEDVPQVPAGVLARPEDRLRPLLNLAARGVALQFFMEHRLLGPGAGWQGGWQRQPVRLALAAAAAAAARVLRVRPRRPRWGALGAPRRQPLWELLADALVSAATLCASLEVTRIPALYQALFGPLAPSWLGEMAEAGRGLLKLAVLNTEVEVELEAQTARLGELFRARPMALAALHAALLARQARSGSGGLAGI